MKPVPMNAELVRLLEQAKTLPPMTPAQLRQQRISWAYGNVGIENTRVTREMAEKIHDEMYGNPEDSEQCGQ